MMMSSMTSNEVMLRSIHQIKDHSLTIGGGGERGRMGGHMVLRGEGIRWRDGKSTPAEHKERIGCQ